MRPYRTIFRSWSLLLCLLVLGLLAQGANLLWAKATEEDLAKVKPGMSSEEVVQIMGEPDRDAKVREEELCRLFVYKNVGRYRIVNIWFDCENKVRAIDKAR